MQGVNDKNRIRPAGGRCDSINVHELLRHEIYKQGSSSDTGFQLTIPANSAPQPVNQQPPQPAPTINVGFEDWELYFDSTQRDTSSDYSIGEIKWNIPTLNNFLDIKSCIELRIDEFYFPKIYSPAGKPEFLYFRRVFVEFQSAPSNQAVLAPNGNRFHFEFDVQNISGQAVKLVPIKNTFFFRRPISSLTDFQIRFMVPPNTSQPTSFRRIPIPADTVSIVTVLTGGFGYNPIRFQIAADTTAVLGPVGSTGTPGIAVFISGYVSNDGLVNSAINNQNGVYVTNIIDDTTFEIAGIDASAVNSTFGASMFIPKNRIAFPVRFTSVRDQPTNYVEANHI